MNLRPIFSVPYEATHGRAVPPTPLPRVDAFDSTAGDVYQEIEVGPSTILGEEGAFWKSYLKEAKAFDKYTLCGWSETLEMVARFVSQEICSREHG